MGGLIRHFIGYRRMTLSIFVAAILLAFAEPFLFTIFWGLPLILVGLSIRTWSSGYISKNQELAREGPYAFTRNPLYLGNFLIGLGFAVIAGRVSLFFLFLISFTIIYFSTIAEEEVTLQNQFGQEFSEYTRKIPRFFPWPAGTTNGQIKFQWERVKDHREYNAWLAVGVFFVLMVFKSYFHVF